MQGLARCGRVMKGGGLLSLTGKLSRSQTNTIFEGHRFKESDMLHLSSRLHVAAKLKWRMNRLRLSLNTETNLFLV